jgi:hypothetical protein
MIKNTFAAIGVTICVLAILGSFGFGHFRILFTNTPITCIEVDYD